jgi:Rod binding domain-containing protein
MQNDNSVALMNANYGNALKSTKYAASQSDKLLREQTDKFEAFFLKQILDIAMDGDGDNKLFPKDAGDKIYQSMYNDTMSSALSGGLGISEMVFNYLKEGR